MTTPQPDPAAVAEANRLHRQALADAERIRATARDEASRIVGEATAAATDTAARKQRRGQAIDDWSPRVALGATILLTASGEYELATLAGWHPGLAWGLPLAIDVYVVQAMRRHRDVFLALTLMVVANAVFHLADAGLFGMRAEDEPEWWLIAAVAAIAPWVMLRIHAITAPPRAKKRRQKQPEQPAQARQQAPPEPPPTAPDPGANTDRQDAANTPPEPPASKPTTGDGAGARKPAKKTRQQPAKKPARRAAKTRRSMSEWVDIGTPIFRDEFARLRRNPTGAEFAEALANAGHGRPSASTAKNIRTEILDRAELPALD
jgi:hypothetical protein